MPFFPFPKNGGDDDGNSYSSLNNPNPKYSKNGDSNNKNNNNNNNGNRNENEKEKKGNNENNDSENELISNRIKVGETIKILEQDIKNYLDFKYSSKAFSSCLHPDFQFIIRNPISSIGTKLLTRRRWSYHFWYSVFRFGLMIGLYFYYYDPKIVCTFNQRGGAGGIKNLFDQERRVKEKRYDSPSDANPIASSTAIQVFKWKIEGKPLSFWKRMAMIMTAKRDNNNNNNNDIERIPTRTTISAHSIYYIDIESGKAYRHIIDWMEPINMPRWWLSGLNIYYKICNVAFKPKMEIQKTK